MKTVWLNLPVRDVRKSRAFFTAIGFRENPRHADSPDMASFFIGENDFVLMLFPDAAFSGFAHHAVSDTGAGTEALINIGAESREDVDRMAEAVRKAGGEVYAGPGESQGWMYACGFADPDGHRWCMLHMDMAKMPKG